MHNILIVDDESGIRLPLKGVLEDEGYKVAIRGKRRGLPRDSLRKRAFDVVLLDVWLPGMDGLETLQKIRDMESAPEVIMISGHGTIETAVRATKLGAYDFLEKPLSIDKTLILVKHAVDAKQMRQENRELKKQLVPPQRHRGGKHSHESVAPADPTDGADQWARPDLWRIPAPGKNWWLTPSTPKACARMRCSWN